MGGEGLEPSQPCGHRILSPTCIPIPPPAQKKDFGYIPTIAFLSVSTTRPENNLQITAFLLKIKSGGEERNRTAE